jgi:hypothetical protein
LQFVVAIGEFVPNWRITTIACIVPVVLGKIFLQRLVITN